MTTSTDSDLIAQVESLTKLNATLTSQYDEMTESIEEMYTVSSAHQLLFLFNGRVLTFFILCYAEFR